VLRAVGALLLIGTPVTAETFAEGLGGVLG
jgi:hypothetical protein